MPSARIFERLFASGLLLLAAFGARADSAPPHPPFELRHPQPAKQVVAGVVTDQVLAGAIASAGGATGMRIEIGAADIPICSDCIEIDRYRSSYDLANQVRAEHGEAPLSPEAYRQNMGVAAGTPEAASLTAPWAAAKSGVIADVRHLPLKDRAASLIIIKNFPWNFPSDISPREAAETHAFIDATFRELKRVLSADGSILILGEGDDKADLAQRYDAHARKAEELGLTTMKLAAVGTTEGYLVGGFVITRPNTLCSRLLMGSP